VVTMAAVNVSMNGLQVLLSLGESHLLSYFTSLLTFLLYNFSSLP